MTTDSSESPPTIPGLLFVGPLGSGGYSEVYLYEQQMPRRKVAVKVLKNVGLTETIRRQFTAEANAMAELADHPNIVSVFTADIAVDGRPYLVMTYYPRDNLGVRAGRERFAVSEVLKIGIQIASAVETAHHAGILHRDIKPANILTNQYGAVGLTDFGIAAQMTAVDDDDDDTGVSVPWSPPEVLYASAPASVQSDVYSLGATLWHLLVGRSPFEVAGGDNSAYALMRRARDSPTPSTGRADVPTSLDRLLAQAMSKDPIARPSSALDLARSLQAVEQELRLPRTEIVILSEDDIGPRRHEEASADVNATRMRAPVRVDAQPPPASASPREPTSWAPSSTPSEARSDGPDLPPTPETVNRPRPVSPSRAAAPPPVRSVPSDVAAAQSHAVPAAAPAPSRAGRARPLAAGGPASAPAGETIRRQVGTPDEPAGAGEPTQPGIRPPLVAAAIAFVVLVAVLLGVVLTSGGSNGGTGQAATATSQEIAQPDDGPPGPPTVTGRRLNPETLEFSWTGYENSQPSDTFAWRYLDDDTHHGTSAAPTTQITSATDVCIQVRVIRADGSHVALKWSEKGCPS